MAKGFHRTVDATAILRVMVKGLRGASPVDLTVAEGRLLN